MQQPPTVPPPPPDDQAQQSDVRSPDSHAQSPSRTPPPPSARQPAAPAGHLGSQLPYQPPPPPPPATPDRAVPPARPAVPATGPPQPATGTGAAGCLVASVAGFIAVQLVLLLLFSYLGRVQYTLLLAPWFFARATPLLLLLWLRSSRVAALPICIGVGVAQLIASATVDPLVLSQLSFPRGTTALATFAWLALVFLIAMTTISRHDSVPHGEERDLLLLRAGMACLLYLLLCFAPLLVLIALRLLLRLPGWMF